MPFSKKAISCLVTNWDIRDIHRTKTLWRYEVQADGTLKNGKIFFGWNLTEDDKALDGMKVDKEGNLYLSDGKTLYMTAHPSLYKLRVNTGGKFSWE